MLDTVDGRNPTPVENGGTHPIILFGFQPSFWWCMILQSPTVFQTAFQSNLVIFNDIQSGFDCSF